MRVNHGQVRATQVETLTTTASRQLQLQTAADKG